MLSRIGMPSHLKGYQYLKTALAICMEDMEALDGITKKLYPAVARKHKTTGETVEHAVRHAIESAWKRGDEKEQKNLFGYCQSEGKRPTNSEFIARMADFLLHDTTSFLS
nr:sporulation initiation factor Spo0A C-terminal domain-containing protein [uncultured Eisenbergiella sp.]